MTILRPEALPVLAHQRPTYLNLAVSKASVAFGVEIHEYCAQMRKYYPKPNGQPRTFLDIGCGIGFGLLVLRNLYGPNNRFFGIDRSLIDENIYYGYEEVASAYNNLDVTRNTALDNGIEARNLMLINIDDEDFPRSEQFDIVTSHIAWGFHFPVGTYLPRVKEATRKGGIVCLDLRKGTGGVSEMSKHFELRAAFPSTKYLRTVWERT